MTPQTVIDTARYVVNDTVSTLYRQANTELLAYVNAGIQEASALRPEWFYSVTTFSCTAGQVEQNISPTTAQELVKVISVNGGNIVTPFDMDAMDRFRPGWRVETAGAAQQWGRFTNDGLRFFVYPKAPVSQTLDVLVVTVPTTLALTDPITEVPTAVEAALADYVIYRAESKDDEHVNSGRAAAAYQSFVAKIKEA